MAILLFGMGLALSGIGMSEVLIFDLPKLLPPFRSFHFFTYQMLVFPVQLKIS